MNQQILNTLINKDFPWLWAIRAHWIWDDVEVIVRNENNLDFFIKSISNKEIWIKGLDKYNNHLVKKVSISDNFDLSIKNLKQKIFSKVYFIKYIILIEKFGFGNIKTETFTILRFKNRISN